MNTHPTVSWRVTVVSGRHRRRLDVTTYTADAREAYDAAVSILKSWPPGSRIVEVVPTGRLEK